MNNVSPYKNIGSLRHILLVDNDPTKLEMTAILLEQQGYFVTCSTTGIEAIILVKEYLGFFDFVLTNYDLPIINGVELAILIKDISGDIPIILYKDKNDFIDEAWIYKVGTTEIANKLCKIKSLDEIIKRVII